MPMLDIAPLLTRKVVTPSGCWEWTGARTPEGYGRLSINGHQYYTHRIAWVLDQGPIPEGHHVDHLCRNRACFFPGHLEPVTPSVNALRSPLIGGKTHCKRGHPFDDANTYVVPKTGHRQCRRCRADGMVRQRQQDEERQQ